MIDDREEFADPEKLSQADEVYCRDFHDIEDILPEQDNAFYVVVTRGHANDRTDQHDTCTNRIKDRCKNARRDCNQYRSRDDRNQKSRNRKYDE